MTYSIVKDGVVLSSGHDRPKRIGNTFVGTSSDIRQFGYYPEVGEKPPLGDFEEAVIDAAIFNGEVVEIAYRVEKLPPPRLITRRQGKQQLIIDELDEAVEAAIANVTDVKQRKLLQTWYDDADPWERNNPYLQQLGSELGLTEAQIDTMFKAASQL